ncbi:unnamed protein product, partial [marine sediment metagenome]
ADNAIRITGKISSFLAILIPLPLIMGLAHDFATGIPFPKGSLRDGKVVG